MLNNLTNKLHNLSNGARWLIAIGAILVFLAISAICSTFWMFMAVISTDACARMPDWMEILLILPPAFLALGSLLGPLLFGFRVRLPIVLGSLIVSVVVGLLLSIAWFPIVISQC